MLWSVQRVAIYVKKYEIGRLKRLCLFEHVSFKEFKLLKIVEIYRLKRLILYHHVWYDEFKLLNIVEFFCLEWLVLYQHDALKSSKCRHLCENSWNRPTEKVCVCINIYDLKRLKCRHLYQNRWNLPTEKVFYVRFEDFKLFKL